MPILLLAGSLLGLVFVATHKKQPAPATKPKQANPKSGKADLGLAAQVVGAAIAGAAVGGALDKALGGTDPNTHLEAEIGGGAIAVSAVLVMAGVIAFPVGITIALVCALGYVVGSIFSDDARLRYGPNGCLTDYLANRTKTHDLCMQRWEVDPTYAKMTTAQIERQLTPFVDGYCHHLNEIAYQKWMKTPFSIPEGAGITTGNWTHESFGFDRGYFVAHDQQIYLCAQSAWVLQYVPQAERKDTTITAMVPTQDAIASIQADTANSIGSSHLRAIDVRRADRTPKTYTFSSDNNAQKYIDAGIFYANCVLYCNWVKAGNAPLDGLHNSEFFGSVDNTGRLTFQNKTIDYRDYKV